MVILKDISYIWSLIHSLVIILFLFEPRYPKKKTRTIAIAAMSPLIVLNFLLFLAIGADKYGTLMLATLSFPTLVVFWFLGKYRDGRYFFTFFMVDTVVVEIMYLTDIINHYLTPDTYLFIFVVRLIAFPIIEVAVYKKLRPMFLDVKKRIQKGWTIFALIGATFYLAISLFAFYPAQITVHPAYIPFLAILLVLMPMVFIHIIVTLRNQQKASEARTQENILRLQVSSLTLRMDELAAADERFRVERHNFRHQLKTIASLIKREEYSECLKLLEGYDESLGQTKLIRYCQHSILDATLSTYIQRARNKGIRLDMGFAFPDVIPVNEAELATAIANALENAINACENLNEEKRFIEIKAINRPRFMMRIVNSYEGEVEFNEDGIPINEQEGHGFGTRFIAAFCEKNGGFYQFLADGERFSLMLNF